MVISSAPPKVLSMEEYRWEWQPQGWELIIIGPTSTWRQEWGEWQAIRDIVQNALDEAEAYQWGYDRQGLWIRDQGRGVAVADFLLGPPKLKPDYARGKFGEGMKIASLALVRRGYSVHIETVGRDLWIIFLEQKVDGAVETLAAMWRPNGTARGTTFHIIGYFDTAYEDRFAVNLPRTAIVAETPSPITTPIRRYNQLIEYGFPTGWQRIYARDIYMRDINSLYSYNLWGFDMAPDRHGPKYEGDMWADMGRLWCCNKNVKQLEILMQMVREPPVVETDESRHLSMSSFDMGRETVTDKRYIEFIKDNALEWRAAWRNNFGRDAVIRTDSRWDNVVEHLGYKSVGVQWGVKEALGMAITTDADLVKASQERLEGLEIIPDKKLNEQQLAHLNLARAIVNEIFTISKVEGVHVAMIPPASDRVRTAGMYSRPAREIYISTDQLGYARDTIDTVIHEMAHHMSGAEDLEEGHSAAMTQLAARVVEDTSKGVFDEFLKKARW